MTFQKRFERFKGASLQDLEKSIPAIGNSKYKGPEGGAHQLDHSVIHSRGHVKGDPVRETGRDQITGRALLVCDALP